MKKLFLSLLILSLFTGFGYGQMRNQNRNRPATQSVDPEKEKAKYEARVEEEKQKYIAEFMTTLNVDDFQKEIIYQAIDSYFDEVDKINKLGLDLYQRNEEIERLDVRHFKDVKAVVNEEVMTQIMDAVKGKWDRKEQKKKQKKKRKNRKNKS